MEITPIVARDVTTITNDLDDDDDDAIDGVMVKTPNSSGVSGYY